MIKTMKKPLLFVALVAAAMMVSGLVGCLKAAEPSAAADLRAEFVDPPAEARPWVLWYWRGQYLSEEGITADLEAFRDAGIAGVHLMNVDRLVKQGPVRLYSPEWMRLMRNAIKKAGRMGIAVNL